MSKEVSIIHSSFDGRMIAAAMDEFAKDHFDASEYRSLKKLGMGFNPGVLAEMARHAYAMDAIQQPLTAAGVPTPVQFLQNWLPGFVKIIFAAREIEIFVEHVFHLDQIFFQRRGVDAVTPHRQLQPQPGQRRPQIVADTGEHRRALLHRALDA